MRHTKFLGLPVVLLALATGASAPEGDERLLTSPASDTVVQVPVREIRIAIDTVGSGRATLTGAWRTVGLSLLLPGAGHRDLGRDSRARPWLATELAAWVALIASWQMSSTFLDDAREIATRHAGIDASVLSAAQLEELRNWRSRRPVAGRRDSRDEAELLSGRNVDAVLPAADAYAWDWGSPEDPENAAHIRSFEGAMRNYRVARVGLSFAVGTLLVSRATAAFDALRLHRKAFRMSLHAIPGPQGGKAHLAVRF